MAGNGDSVRAIFFALGAGVVIVSLLMTVANVAFEHDAARPVGRFHGGRGRLQVRTLSRALGHLFADLLGLGLELVVLGFERVVFGFELVDSLHERFELLTDLRQLIGTGCLDAHRHRGQCSRDGGCEDR